MTLFDCPHIVDSSPTVANGNGFWRRSLGNSKIKVFIVLHHEIMGTPQDWRVDEMIFYTCTSLKKALELIRKTGVVRYSWWEIQVQDMDSPEWPAHVGYYGRRGGKLTRAPYEKCVEIFKKEVHT